MTASLQQARAELEQHIAVLVNAQHEALAALYAAQDRHDRAKEQLHSASCALQFLDQVIEQLPDVEVSLNLTVSDRPKNDMTQTDTSSKGGAS